jgi:hypothetical protein
MISAKTLRNTHFDHANRERRVNTLYGKKLVVVSLFYVKSVKTGVFDEK